MTVRKRKLGALVAPLLALALFASACGDDSEDTTPATTAAAGATTTAAGGSGTTLAPGTVATTPGCEKRGYSDPANLSASRQVARCDPNTPAPKPLPTKEKVVVSSSFRLEFNSPLGLALSKGEFAKENLDVEIQNVSFANAAPQLATGQIDVAVGGFETALFGAGVNNLPIRIVMGNYYPPRASNYTVPQTGLWCRRDIFTTPQSPKLKELEGKKWATSVGRGSSAMYYSVAEILKREPSFDYKKVEVQAVPSTDILNAVRSKNIDCGILLDPLWIDVKDDPAWVQVATQTPGEPLGIYAFGKRMLQDRKDVGEAFVRAFIRTINTYFAGDYHKDAAVMAEIQKFTGQTNEVFQKLATQDSLVMDWEIRKDTTTRIQQLFIDSGVEFGTKTPVPEDKLVDRSFYEKVVGAVKK